ncbi:TetR/AcrR family transcriptional regulator [Actinophytocola sp.]|uniref:TetR/AcrR family transcriptional regulator n=1 Tax=Actinophytocola sp. TaxID=1872138 RepID=UPI003D6C239A
MAGTGAAVRRTYGGRSAGERRAERRQRLLTAGLALIGTEGYAATSIEKLCALAGVSTRNFYEEFNSREHLLMALHDQIIEQAFHAVRAALDDADDAPLPERFTRAVRAFVTTTASDPRWARLSYVEIIGVSNVVEKHRIAWRERWANFLVSEARRAVERGEATDRDFHLGAVALIGAVNELVHHWSLSGGKRSLDDVITEIVRVATATVTAP